VKNTQAEKNIVNIFFDIISFIVSILKILYTSF